MNLPLFKLFFKEHFTAFTVFFILHQVCSDFNCLCFFGFFFFCFSEECDSSNISVLINLCFTQDGLQWLRLNN